MFDFVGGNEESCVCTADWNKKRLTSLKLLEEEDEIKLSIRMEQDTEPKVIAAK